jgi:hypothetical protein
LTPERSTGLEICEIAGESLGAANGRPPDVLGPGIVSLEKDPERSLVKNDETTI